MQGLTELPEMGLEFDKPGGRIVEAVAGGTVTQAQVIEFYRRSLPQLGWQRAEGQGGSFVRDKEWLSIDFPPAGPGNQTLVRFRITPWTPAHPSKKQ